MLFDGHPLIVCIARIRDDILKIWNFYDPLKVSVCIDILGNEH
jgi:hypothetical protein